MSKDEHENDALSYWKNGIGTCYTCGEHVLIRELIRIEYSSHTWWLCECCHSAYYYNGYSPLQIGKDLLAHDAHRLYGEEQNKEVNDPKRKSTHKAISLEEMADFMYWLYKEGSKIIDRIT